MGEFVRTPWGIECFMCRTEFGWKHWGLLPLSKTDDEVMSYIETFEKEVHNG